jgi:hypothetical protein
MSASGQKQTYAVHKAMSALPPKATSRLRFDGRRAGDFWLFHLTPLPETVNGFQLAAAVITVCICSSDNAIMFRL